MISPQNFPQSGARPRLSGVPEQSKFRCEIYLNPDYSRNRVSLLDGYSTMRMGETVHKEPQNAVDCLTSFARRLVANGYFQYEVRGQQRIFRATAINFYMQAPHFESKDKHPLVMQLTPHEPIVYGYFGEDLALKERLVELYQVVLTGDVASIKRDNYQRRNDERRDFTYKGKTFDDLTKHCKGLLDKGYDRPRVVAFWRTIKNQYYPNYEANMTQLTVEARETGLGYPDQVRHVHERLTRGRRP